ncbi:MAG: DUF1573 domain-containing protein [Candidatus Omnitrophica bacterium]|nr:DUF1573 domain-containing protein [Candidatus Omnitrophota bacterium]
MQKIMNLFLISFFIFQIAYAQAPIGQPEKVEPSVENSVANSNEWDFGKVKSGKVLKHDFLFKNETKNVLKILSINTSCGCTASQADKKILAPNESTTVNVIFKSEGYSGAVKQSVYVNTDNTDLPIIKFTVKAEVVK